MARLLLVIPIPIPIPPRKRLGLRRKEHSNESAPLMYLTISTYLNMCVGDENLVHAGGQLQPERCTGRPAGPTSTRAESSAGTRTQTSKT